MRIKEQETRLTLHEHDDDDDDDDDDDIHSYDLKAMITGGGAQLWAAPLERAYTFLTHKRDISPRRPDRIWDSTTLLLYSRAHRFKRNWQIVAQIEPNTGPRLCNALVRRLP